MRSKNVASTHYVKQYETHALTVKYYQCKQNADSYLVFTGVYRHLDQVRISQNKSTLAAAKATADAIAAEEEYYKQWAMVMRSQDAAPNGWPENIAKSLNESNFAEKKMKEIR